MIWTGEDFQLEIPAALDTAPANWLNCNLHTLLERSLLANIAVEVRPGRQSEGGLIALHGLRPPLPSVSVIHKIVSDAVNQAYAAAQEADGEAGAYLQQLHGL
jgi:hypothetical protein